MRKIADSPRVQSSRSACNLRARRRSIAKIRDDRDKRDERNRGGSRCQTLQLVFNLAIVPLRLGDDRLFCFSASRFAPAARRRSFLAEGKGGGGGGGGGGCTKMAKGALRWRTIAASRRRATLVSALQPWWANPTVATIVCIRLARESTRAYPSPEGEGVRRTGGGRPTHGTGRRRTRAVAGVTRELASVSREPWPASHASHGRRHTRAMAGVTREPWLARREPWPASHASLVAVTDAGPSPQPSPEEGVMPARLAACRDGAGPRSGNCDREIRARGRVPSAGASSKGGRWGLDQMLSDIVQDQMSPRQEFF